MTRVQYASDRIVSMYQSGMRAPQIAEEIGVGTTTVYRVLSRAGIERTKDWYRKFTNDEEAAMVTSYAEGAAASVLAERHGCDLRTVLNIVRRRNGQVRPPGNRERKLTPEQETEAVTLYRAGFSQEQVGVQVGASQAVVGRVLREQGIETRRERAARGPDHGSWRGGRIRSGEGYVALYANDDDPIAWAMRNNQGYVLEHRLVMGRALGRPLASNETVHHINQDRADNRLENLQLRIGKHGAGAVYRCSDCGSRRIEAAPLAPSTMD